MMMGKKTALIIGIISTLLGIGLLILWGWNIHAFIIAICGLVVIILSRTFN
jgi:uncharacterized membrane protein